MQKISRFFCILLVYISIINHGNLEKNLLHIIVRFNIIIINITRLTQIFRHLHAQISLFRYTATFV